MHINIHLQLSKINHNPGKIDTFTKEGNLIYADQGHKQTIGKFALLTATSPIIGVARLVRSAVFACSGDTKRAGREFIGGIATPIVAGGCLLGSLASAIITVINPNQRSLYASMRRTYAYFEAWINGIDLQGQLPSYSRRVSGTWNVAGVSGSRYKNIWTTAPCMQPLFENGFSKHGGLLDAKRMQKIYPFIPVDQVRREQDKIIIDSHYVNEATHYTTCNNACEHGKASFSCCCWRIETVYDRCLCCEAAQGTCTNICDPGNSCGIVSCCMCGMGVCCCYLKEDDKLTAVNTGCFGPQGLSCVTGWS